MLDSLSPGQCRVMLKWRLGIREVLATVRKLAKEEAIANGELPMDEAADKEEESDDGSEDGSGSEVDKVGHDGWLHDDSMYDDGC
jgi:hypothetical protein